ncbi:unnamed protein product [Urochloa humidicola]
MDADGGSSTARNGAASRAGADPPQRPSWRPPRPRLVAYAAATSSSTSGGSLSTTYTSGSSHLLSSSSSGDGGLTQLVEETANKLERVQLPCLEIEEEREKTRGHIRGLVEEFSAAAGDDEATALILERWFSDLGLSWVLSIATVEKSPAGSSVFPRRLGDLARSWIVALTVIQISIFTYFDGLSTSTHDETSDPAASEFARFLQLTLSKMLLFIDAVASAKVNGPCIQHNLWEAMETAEEKLRAVIGVRHAVSEASQQIQMWPRFPPFEGSRVIIEETSSSLSAKLAKLDEAVWDTLDEIRTSIIMSLTDNHSEADSVDSQALERSSDIHKTTRSLGNCIKVLSTDYGLVNEIVSKATSLGKYVPQDNRMGPPFYTKEPLDMLIMEMLSCLQENLDRVSQSFPDQSLRFLFLLNNTHFMWQQLQDPSLSYALAMWVFTRKIDERIQRYLQASWIPVVSGLHGPTPLCFGRYHSPLAKFESEFHKTYSAQKLWKVPDPELRGRLRKAIIETVIPAFAKYLEDNKITAPRVTQQELEDMLQNIFEG